MRGWIYLPKRSRYIASARTAYKTPPVKMLSIFAFVSVVADVFIEPLLGNGKFEYVTVHRPIYV
jgi:hypothetical protein